jgi:hypothetical protein
VKGTLIYLYKEQDFGMYVTATHLKAFNQCRANIFVRQKQKKARFLAARVYICRRIWAELLFVRKTAKSVAFEGFVHCSCSAEAFRVSNFFFVF